MVNTFEIKFESFQLTDEQFYQLCQDNRDLRLERNRHGDMLIMPPTGGETSNKNLRILQQLGMWTDENNTGIAFDSSGGFKLPNGADRSPDAAWIPKEKWENLTPEQRQKFLPFCPDFLIEFRSPSDNLNALQKKMEEYIKNGTKLAWLINPQDRQVEVYRKGQAVERLDDPQILSGESILPNFVLKLEKIW
ncbi:MAG: Uma2 family endonuclease [Crocosphaera sp.]